MISIAVTAALAILALITQAGILVLQRLYPAQGRMIEVAGASLNVLDIGPRDAGGFGLAVKLHVKDKSLPTAELTSLVNEAHEKICPYSHATRGNVQVDLEVEGA